MTSTKATQPIKDYLEKVVLEREATIKNTAKEEIKDFLDDLTHKLENKEKTEIENKATKTREHKDYEKIWIPLQKAKSHIKNGKIVFCIDELMKFHFHLGKIGQELKEKTNRDKISQKGTDTRYGFNRELREEAAKLLAENRPEGGWKTKSVAIDFLYIKLNTKVKENHAKVTFAIDKFKKTLEHWLDEKKYPTYKAFIENASSDWIKKYGKDQTSPNPKLE